MKTAGAILAETPWETRNLGRPAFALDSAFFEQPREEALRAELSALHAHGPHFILARLPSRYLSAAPLLTRLGFYPVECAVSPFTRFAANDHYQRFLRDPASFMPDRHALDEFRYESLIRGPGFPMAALQTLAAESFSRDRFHLDPLCPPGVADRRFAHWITDQVADPAVCIDALWQHGKMIGFVTHREAYLNLIGVDRAHAGTGLGKFLACSACRRMEELGHAGLESCISTNNLPMLNLMARLGFKFKAPLYSFHYWSAPVSPGCT